MSYHTDELERTALLALDALPASEERQAKEHLRLCRECTQEYAELLQVGSLIGYRAEASPTAETSAALDRVKTRLLAEISRRDKALASFDWWRTPRVPRWAFALACFALVCFVGWESAELHHATLASQRAAAEIAQRQIQLDVLLAPGTTRTTLPQGLLLRHGRRLAVLLDHLPPPPSHRIYQAWLLPIHQKRMVPQATFIPDTSGRAAVVFTADASVIQAIAVSTEPVGGSQQPTTTPLFVHVLG